MKNQMDADLLKSALNTPETLAAVADAIQKAAVTSGTYTFSPATRSIFVAENLDPVIKTIVPTATPIRSLLPRRKGSGQATSWKKLTSKLNPSATGTSTLITFADGGTPLETTQTYSVVTAAYKLLGRKVSVGLQMIAASKNYTPAEQEQVRVKTLETLLGEEYLIINGNSGSEANSFDGLLTQISTNVADLAGGSLTISGIGNYDKTIFETGGGATHLFLGPSQNANISREAKAAGSTQIIVSNQNAAVANMRVSAVISESTGIPIKLIVSRYMGTNAILGTLKSPAGENYVEMEDLIPLIKMDVPEATFAKTSFIVESTVLKLIAEPYFFKLTNLG